MGDIFIVDYMSIFGLDYVIDIIENMVGNLGKCFFVNMFNNGVVINMNDDLFLELLCDVSIEGVKLVYVGEMLRGIWGM